ncbi:hypothetical protein [Sphingomonas sp.]|uniref:hypothetical protein n=1 Tax=Sphingomonas sp. TaxID=28214 RepID=UPI001EBB3A56|nr:hypothetical protein [Sphingomonas sp.]MBX3595733.1 hypothetical protein [Sphingomonas sp.]
MLILALLLQSAPPAPMLRQSAPAAARATPVQLARKRRQQGEARALIARAAATSAKLPAGHPDKAQLDAMIGKAKGDLDSMAEMDEMESLRLQMAMDRMSKIMSTLSNLLKKISDTNQSITQNLK